MLNDDGTASCGFLGTFVTPKVLGSLSEVSLGSTKPTKMIVEQEIIFEKTAKTLFLHRNIQDTFE